MGGVAGAAPVVSRGVRPLGTPGLRFTGSESNRSIVEADLESGETGNAHAGDHDINN